MRNKGFRLMQNANPMCKKVNPKVNQIKEFSKLKLKPFGCRPDITNTNKFEHQNRKPKAPIGSD